MILRKPYALLIKFFRPIHFVLAILMGFLSYKFYDIYLFLKQYIINGYYTYVKSLVSTYINVPMYFAFVLILILIIVVISLLTYKKKPTLLYWLILGTYILGAFFLIRVYNNFSALELDRVNIRTLLVTRDIALGISVAGVGLVIWSFLRSLGFNLKSFQFGKDIKELQIEMQDDEEFEFTIDVDKDEVQTKWRKRMRKLKYYLIEHNRIILLIFLGILMVIGASISYNIITKSKVYSENAIVQLNDERYTMKVVNSYLVNKSYNQQAINNYLVVKMELQSQTADNKLDPSKIHLIVDDKMYKSETIRYDYFNDIGMLYGGELIGETSTQYIIVYKIDSLNIRNASLKIERSKRDAIIKLKPISFDDPELVSTSNLKEELWFNNSILATSFIKIDSYDVKDQFVLDVDNKKIAVIPNNLSSKNSILRLSVNLSIPKNLYLFDFTKSKFVGEFARLKYVVAEKEYISLLLDKTPKIINDDILFEVDSNIKDATSISLEFVIRDKQYVYYLLK